jgi:DNA-directed RNA polymerase specialized sigma24 family protein
MQPTAGVCQETYRQLLAAARRFVRSEDEARDLTQDALMLALARGFDDWASPERRRWLHGVVRKRAAFIARSQLRRRRREALVEAPDTEKSRWLWYRGFLDSLPPSLRVVAKLASADLCGAEIRWLLELTDAAWRQRLTALRRAVAAEAARPTLTTSEPPLSFGASRPLVLASLQRQGGRVLATRDPDGHTILLRRGPHKPRPLGNGGVKEFP